MNNRESEDRKWALVAVAIVFLLFACAWGFWIAIFARSEIVNMAAALLSGIIAGFYCSVIMLCGAASTRHVLGSLAVLGIGITHVVWITIASRFFMMFDMQHWDGPLLVVLTGLVFAAVIGCTTESWWTFLAILVGSSVVAVWSGLSEVGSANSVLFAGAGLLHLCIAIPVFVWTVRSIFREPIPDSAQNVGAA
jgi:hypothetical protein